MSFSQEKFNAGGVMTVDPTPVSFINQEVFSYGAKEATVNAYQAVAQSMAQMIQNANTTLLNTEALVQAAQAVFMKKAAEEPNYAKRALWLKSVQEAAAPLETMVTFVGKVGTTADDILNDFPVGRSNVSSEHQEKETP